MVSYITQTEFESRMLKRIFGPKTDDVIRRRKVHSGEL
jgi:hypothetical protein